MSLDGKTSHLRQKIADKNDVEGTVKEKKVNEDTQEVKTAVEENKEKKTAVQKTDEETIEGENKTIFLQH